MASQWEWQRGARAAAGPQPPKRNRNSQPPSSEQAAWAGCRVALGWAFTQPRLLGSAWLAPPASFTCAPPPIPPLVLHLAPHLPLCTLPLLPTCVCVHFVLRTLHPACRHAVPDEEGDDDDEVNVVDLMSEEEAAGADNISDSGGRGGLVVWVEMVAAAERRSQGAAWWWGCAVPCPSLLSAATAPCLWWHTLWMFVS
jgi:hypothetical protein